MAMSEEKLKEVLGIYENKALQLIDDVFDIVDPWVALRMHAAKKIYGMIDPCRDFLEHDRREKLMRWLGFMQGAWWLAGVYSVDELKNHNRPSSSLEE